MKKENNGVAVASIIAGAIIVVALLVLVFAGNFGISNKDTVTVQGMSTVKVLPDIVSVHFTIETTGETSAEANEKNQEIYNDLLVALVLEGFSESEIGTEYFNIYPKTYYENGQTNRDGFTAVHSVKVEFSANESRKLASVVDSGIESGAGISYINFELSQSLQNEYKGKALELASADAKVKAESVAKGFGKDVGRLVSVSVDNYGYYPWVMYSAEDSGSAASAKVAAQSIRPTTQDVTASVSATYKLV
ncbi:MAG: SIMPL domain-containing protein [archaeon]|nr:SIMPL domain-containing protein [archaeon]